MLLKDKVCLITGTNRGIGKSVLTQFAKERAIIYANARQEGSIDDLAAELSSIHHTTIIPVYFDIRDTACIRKTMQKIQKEHGKLDVLVNNAGIMKDALIGMISNDLLTEVFETNVFASMNLLQYATRLMKHNSSGSIINFSSVVGIYGHEGQMAYAASKGAVIAMTKSAAKELAPFQIRVNAVAPGIIDTDLIKVLDEKQLQAQLEQIGMNRLGQPDDVAKVCVFLASDYSEYVTGQILGIDGGTIM